MYQTIGAFYDTFTSAGFEGRDVTAASAEFWEGLETAIVGDGETDPVVLSSSRMVQLRLYQVAFESISSPTYLAAFRQAGVSSEDVVDLLQTIYDRLDEEGFRNFVETNPAATEAIYNQVMDGYDEALANIARTYNSPTTRVRATTGEGGE